jgi:probable rRNA maturation factor
MARTERTRARLGAFEGGVIEVEILGASPAPDALSSREIRRLCVLAAAAVGVEDGHLAIEYVDARRIAELNLEHRGKTGPTDVLSFPIDGLTAQGRAPRELGDVLICPEHTSDPREAIVHGVLHLVGMDHETDDGEMLALQARLLDEAPSASRPSPCP